MGIIDFRVRPPYKSYLNFFTDEYIESFKTFHEGFLRTEFKGSASTASFDEFMEELDRADIEKAVIPGRGFIDNISNDELFEFADKYDGRFIIFPFIDPLEGRKALDDIDKYVINGKGKGVAIEPGLSEVNPVRYDDERLFEVYKKLEDNNIPIMITYSVLAYHDYNGDSPREIDKIATEFPNLTIIVAHGGWPWTLENIAIAFRRPNVYLVPDVYATRGPGADDYITAAKSILKDKIIYASSFPAAPIEESAYIVENEWGLDEETKQKVFKKTAEKILNL